MKKLLITLLCLMLMMTAVYSMVYAADEFVGTDISTFRFTGRVGTGDYVTVDNGTYTLAFGGEDITGGKQTGFRISSTTNNKFGDLGTDEKFILFSGKVTPNAESSFDVMFNDTWLTAIKSSEAYELQVLVDLKGKKVAVYKDGTMLKQSDVTSLKAFYYIQFRSSINFFGHAFEAGEDGKCTKCGSSEATVSRHGTTENPVFVMNMSDFTITEFTTTMENATIEDFKKHLYPPTPTVDKRDNYTTFTKNPDGSYTLIKAKNQNATFHLRMDKAGFFKDGVMDPTIKYVKTDFSFISKYDLNEIAINNQADYISDAYVKCPGKRNVNISIVWDVIGDRYYIYSDNLLSGIKINLPKSTTNSDYIYGIKIGYSSASLPTDSDTFEIGTICNLKQTAYDSSANLEDVGVYTNTATYANGKYTFANHVSYGKGSVDGTTYLDNDMQIFYVGYDAKGEIVFINMINRNTGISVVSPEVECIRTYLWKESNLMPLMRAEGLVKITE